MLLSRQNLDQILQEDLNRRPHKQGESTLPLCCPAMTVQSVAKGKTRTDVAQSIAGSVSGVWDKFFELLTSNLKCF